MKNIFETMLRRKNQFYIPNKLKDLIVSKDNDVSVEEFIRNIELTHPNTKLIFSCCANINKLGYMPTQNLISTWYNFTEKELKFVLREFEDTLKILSGADKTYEPMYPNFPEEVMNMEESQLYFNAFVHYISNGTWMPYTSKIERSELNEDIVFTFVDVGTDEDVIDMHTNLMKSKTSISETDKEDLRTFFVSFPKALKYVPSNIPFKENAAFVSKIIFDNISIICAPDKEIVFALSNFLKTATDVLRFVTELSNGDTSLASPTKYLKMSRPQRKLILALLERTGNIEEDMKRYASYWIKLGEMLHPTEHQKRFPKTANAFYKIRNNVKIDTFNAKLRKMYDSKDFISAVNLLKNRAGEFARNLDYILRNANEKDINTILNTFKSVAQTIATPLLLQIRSHFLYRNNKETTRVAFPKGQLAKAHLITNVPETISENICDKVVKICDMALISNYSTREMMGNVYIAPELKNYIVPFSQRSASDMKKIMTRGSRIAMNSQFVRSFIWWTNDEEHYRIDIDLSAACYDKNFNTITHCSFTKLRDKFYNLAHSGDITNGGPVDGKGAAEFIDIDLKHLAEKGIKYVVFQVYNYTGYGFDKMVHCDFGFMARNDIRSGELFEPSTVVNKMHVNATTNKCIPCAIDVETAELIWLDINGGLNTSYGNNTLEANLVGTTLTTYGIINMARPTMFDTVLLNAIARGEVVDTKDDADIIFDYDYNTEENSVYLSNAGKQVRLVTPYDIDVYMSDLI